jgi:hypothetical protein
VVGHSFSKAPQRQHILRSCEISEGTAWPPHARRTPASFESITFSPIHFEYGGWSRLRGFPSGDRHGDEDPAGYVDLLPAFLITGLKGLELSSSSEQS